MRKPKAVFDQINIVSSDPDASIAFYRRLGVELPDQNVWRTETGAHHANATITGSSAPRFEVDSATFAKAWNVAWQDQTQLAGRVVVGFRADSREAVDTIYADLTGAGHTGLQPPRDGFWGARYAILEDPDGIAVCIMSAISPDRRAPPPDV
ncbi:VOC family protein [Microbacteriaceae bacterium K1510]|nr:VOC family protein [Microbacteriaceae bacterium K1510]